MHNKKKESELTYANRGGMFKSDAEEDVELDNNEHVAMTLNLSFLLLKN